MKKARSLQNSLFFSFSAATLIPIALVAIVIINYLFATTLDGISAKNSLLAVSINSQVEAQLAEPLAIMKNIRFMLENPNDVMMDATQFVLDSHIHNSEIFEAIYILDENFSVIHVGLPKKKVAYSKDYLGINLGHKDFIRGTFSSKQPQWSETFISLLSGKMSVSLSVPLSNQILVADLNISHLANHINQLNIGKRIITTVIDKQGAIIIHPDPNVAARQVMVNNLNLVDKALSGVETIKQFTFDDVRYIGSTKINPATGWIVLVSQPITVAYQPVYRTLIYLGAGIIASMILAFLFAIFKARKLSRPLLELSKHTQTIAGGDYTFFLPSTEYEEVRELSSSISQMTSAINFREQLLIESEQKFREVIEATDNLIARIDRYGNFSFVNPAAEKIFGISLEELHGRSFFEFVHPDDRERTKMAFEKWKRERRKSVVYENRQVDRDGKITYLFWTINFHYDQNGMMTEASTIASNITARFDAEEQKREFEEHIKHAQKMEAIGTLAGGIAHDFNNILTAIIGYTELTFFTGKPSPEICGNLDEILKASHRAKELVKQILAFSRKDESIKKPVNLSLLIKESLKMLRASIPTTIQIQEQIESDCSPVLADPTKIHQLVMNLCTNSYQAMRKTGGVLSLSLSELNASEISSESSHNLRPDNYLKLVVSDSGSGIDPTIMGKIFEPFFTTKPQGEGTGMGLSVVHGVVLSHNGHIEVESSQNCGSTFTIYLPVMAAEDNEHDDEPEQTFLHGTEHILVVDDEKAITNFIERSLTSLGYRVTSFNDPGESLIYLKDENNHVDLMFTDMTMPNINGAELASSTALIRPDLPIVMFTGFSDLIDEQKASDLGIRKYIAKPFEIHEISELIRELLDKN